MRSLLIKFAIVIGAPAVLSACASTSVSSDSRMAESIIASQVSVAADAQREYAAIMQKMHVSLIRRMKR